MVGNLKSTQRAKRDAHGRNFDVMTAAIKAGGLAAALAALIRGHP